LESEAVRDHTEEYHLLRRHIMRINSHPLWKQAHKIFIPENNLGLEASHLHSLVSEYPDVSTYWQHTNRPGVVMTHEAKNLYQKQMYQGLFHGKIVIERDLFTVSRKMDPKKILGVFREQLERYHWELKPPRDNHGKPSWAITGKMGSKNDDLCIAGQQTYLYGHTLQSNPRHEVFSNVASYKVSMWANVQSLERSHAQEDEMEPPNKRLKM
jgi:hypothetical protein